MSDTTTASQVKETILNHLRRAEDELEAARTLADQHCDESADIMRVFSRSLFDYIIRGVDDLAWDLYVKVENTVEEKEATGSAATTNSK